MAPAAPSETTAAPAAQAGQPETTAAHCQHQSQHQCKQRFQETQLDELSRWLAPILRDPEKARSDGKGLPFQKDRRLVQINNNQKVTWQQNGKIPSFFLPPSKGVEVFVGHKG